MVAVMSELDWLLSDEARNEFRQLGSIVRDCRKQLPCRTSNDVQQRASAAQPQKFMITSSGNDHLRCMLTLLGDNIMQAELAVKYPRAPNHVYKGTAQPDRQWKLQQLQDVSNHLQLTARLLDEIRDVFKYGNFKILPTQKVLTWLEQLLKLLFGAQTALILPKKRSIAELHQSKPSRCFLPPMPSDLALSIYLNTYKIYCSVYYLHATTTATGAKLPFTVYQGWCSVPWLNDVLVYINLALQRCQDFKNKVQSLHRLHCVQRPLSMTPTSSHDSSKVASCEGSPVKTLPQPPLAVKEDAVTPIVDIRM